MANKDYPVYVRFPQEDVEVLDRMAEESQRSRSSMVRHLVKLAMLNNLVEPSAGKPAEPVSHP